MKFLKLDLTACLLFILIILAQGIHLFLADWRITELDTNLKQCSESVEYYMDIMPADPEG